MRLECIRCDKPITQDEHGCLDDAMHVQAQGGWGSRNDLTGFRTVICDDCAAKVSPVMRSYDGEDHQAKTDAEFAAWRKQNWKICAAALSPEVGA